MIYITKKITKSGIPLILLMVMQFVLIRECSSQVRPDSDVPKGTMKGQVIDSETKAPLIAANIIIVGTGTGTITDSNGYFTIYDVPVGNYTLRISYIGYESLSKTDIIVKSKRITFIPVGLKMTPIEIEDVIVTAGYFSQTQDQPTSAIHFSSEEIRRAPGSAGDVSRIISGLPSISKINDQRNSLIVRGGSPVGSGFLIDNIEIPNINHYPTQGSSGGPIGLLNVDFIQDVNFYTGGFSATYGDRLSSVMDLTFREGNRYEFDGQLDLNFAGFGFVGEGPLGTEKGSWLLSARRSFLDLLIDAIGTGVAPEYSNYQGKLAYDVNTNNKVTGLGILGTDYIAMTKEQALDDGNTVYFDTDIMESSFGINWRSLWSEKGFSNTSISHISTDGKVNITETRTDDELIKNNSLEQAIQLRNVNYYRLNESNRLEFGLDAKYMINEYDNFIGEYTDALGDTTPEFYIDDRITAQKFGSFASHIWKPFDKITTTAGVRFDYFSYSKNAHISPRFSLSYRINERTSINGSTGIYYQNLPLILLSQKDEFENLNDPVAYHYILGLSHLLTENTKLSIEIYEKEYDNFPLDPTTPPLFILDELFYRYGFFFNHEELDDNGKAYSRGIELMIQKKLAKNVYGLLSGSYFRTRYKDFDEIWRDRVFDNRLLFSAEGGYKPNNKWEFSLRWIYAGGPPYTPFDIAASESINRAVFDQNKINEARYPDYHSLNIRFDRRFHFSGSNLIFYFSVWNAYNRKNVASYYWNETDNRQDTIYQWSLLPVFGLEYEF
jgi:hypothetical protein